MNVVTLAASSAALAILLAACGGAAESKVGSPAKGADSMSNAEPTTVEEAQARIAAAKAELGGRPGGSGGASGFTPPPPPPAADSPSSPSSTVRLAPTVTPPTTNDSAPSSSSPKKASPNVDDRCGNPCRALASMRRAVTALCRMTGDDDDRCQDAKRTLAESEGRISPCSCR